MKVRGLLILLLLPVLAAGQQQYYGTVAASIGTADELDPADLARIPLQPGGTISRENIRASIQALYDTGRYQYIEVDATPGTGGTVLTFRGRRHYYFSTFRLEPPDLLDRSISTYFRLPFGEKFSPTRVEPLIAETTTLLEDAGYFDATVTPEYTFDSSTRLVSVVLNAAVKPRARIDNVEIQGGEQTFEADEIRDALDVENGDEFLAETLDDGVVDLRDDFTDLGFLNTRVNVERSYDPATNTVDLNIGIEPGVFTLVQTRGHDISDSRLRLLVPFFEEGTVDPDLVEEGRARVIEYLQQDGYFEARVTPEIFEAPLDNAVQINYAIEPGERHRIRSIAIEGNAFFSDSELRDRMRIRSAGFLNRGVYSPDLLEEDIAIIETAYRSAGFFDTEVVGTQQETPDHEVDVTIQIREGARYPIDRITFMGNQSIPESDLLSGLPIGSGVTYTPILVEETRAAMTGVYYAAGFPDAQIEANTNLDQATGRVAVTFNVTEGEQYQIGQILVSGNTRTAEKIIHRYTNLYPNTPYDREAILEAQQRLYATGLFNRVEIVPLNEGLESARNLLIQVEEAKPILLSYGLGVKEYEGVRGTFEISHNNLWGLDRAISLRLRGSRRERYLQSTFREPRLFNRNLEGYASLFVEKSERRFFNVNRVDFSLQVLRRFSLQTNVLFTASHQTVNLRDIEVNPNARRIPDVEGVIQIARLGTTFVADWRDDVIEPQSGNFMTHTFQIANKAWGSEVNFVSLFNQSNWYSAVRGGVFATSMRIGWKRPYGGDDELPISERYFAGGSTTLRGFDLDEVGPPGGGQFMTIGNLEYRVPLNFLPLGGIGGALFYDTGTVFERPSDFSFGDFTHTAGAGLRYQTPLGPVRLDFGFNLNPQLVLQPDGTQVREERVQVFFTLGHAF